MISKLSLSNIATFTQKVEIEPTEINYFYGSNGSGKTTLSNVIADDSTFPECCLSWQVNPIETLVYNKDFVRNYFSQSSSIKGIFTLGKDATEAKKYIEETKKDIEGHEEAITGLNKSLENNKTDETQITDEIVGKCWGAKGKHETDFREAYTGSIGSKKAFFKKCLQEQNNTSSLLTLEEIKEKCQKVFSNTLQIYDQVPELVLPDLVTLENHAILKTKIVGKEDVPIGVLIAKLGNSDWIKQGLEYLNQTANNRGQTTFYHIIIN